MFKIFKFTIRLGVIYHDSESGKLVPRSLNGRAPSYYKMEVSSSFYLVCLEVLRIQRSRFYPTSWKSMHEATQTRLPAFISVGFCRAHL